MPRYSSIQSTFNGGIFSPRLYGRTDLDAYAKSARKIENFQITPQGPLVRRSGTRYVAEVVDSSKKSRLIPFTVSDSQAYIIEFAERKIRFFRSEGLLQQQTLENIAAATKVFTTTNEISYLGHGYNHGEGPLQITSTGTLPTGLTALTDYYVRVPQTITFDYLLVSVASNEVTLTSHDLSHKMGPYKWETTGTRPSGISAETDYYIRRSSDDTFLVSLTPGGGGVALGSQGSGTHSLVPTAEYVREKFRLGPADTATPVQAIGSPGSGVHTLTPTSPSAITIETDYLESELFDIQVAQSADILYIVHPDHRPAQLARYSAHGFELTDVDFVDGPYLDENADNSHTFALSATTGNGVLLTSNKAYFTAQDVGSSVRIRNTTGGGTPETFWGYAKIIGVEPVTFQDSDIESHAIASVDTTANDVTTSAHGMDTGELVRLNVSGGGSPPGGLSVATDYYVRRFDADELSFYTTFSDAQDDANRISLSGGFGATCTVISSVIDITAHGFSGGEGPFRLTTTGTLPVGLSEYTDYYIGIVDPDSFFLSLSKNGDPVGFDGSGSGTHSLFGSTAPLPVARINIAEDFANTSAVASWRISAWSPKPDQLFPRAVSFHEQRLWFAANPGAPQTLYASKTADFTNFGPTGLLTEATIDDSVNADNGIQFIIGSNQVNVIQWLSVIRTLMMGTSSSNWSVQASLISEAITPTNIQVSGRSSHGSNGIVPLVVDDRVVYVSDTGLKLFSLGYSFQSDSYVAEDLTILSENITDSGIVDMDFAHEPFSTIWCVKSDGKLAALASVRDQEVNGWSSHSLGGVDASAESVAVISAPSGDPSSVGRQNKTHDQVWFTVSRTVNGETKRWVEFMEDVYDDEDTLVDAFFVDGGVTYNGVAVTTLTAPHLANETVDVVADGTVLLDQTLSADGLLTLDTAASKVHIGYRYFSDFQSLRLDIADAEGTGQGKQGRIDHLVLRLDNSMAGQYGPSVDDLTDLDLVPHDLETDTLSPTYTDDIEVDFDAGWDTYGEIYVRQNQPMPFTLVAVLPKGQKSARGNRAR